MPGLFGKVAKPKEPILRALAVKEAKRILLTPMQTRRIYRSSRRRSWKHHLAEDQHPSGFCFLVVAAMESLRLAGC